MVDIQKPFYSENNLCKNAFPNFGKNVAKLLEIGREKKMTIIHVRAVYNDMTSLWRPAFNRLNPDKWDPG